MLKRCVHCNFSAKRFRQEATEWSESGQIRQLDVWAVCGGLYKSYCCSFTFPTISDCFCFFFKPQSFTNLYHMFLCCNHEHNYVVSVPKYNLTVS